MTYVIKAEGFVTNTPCPHAGQFVESFNHEAVNGRGYGCFTKDIRLAMQFATMGEAIAFWRRVPKNRPTRPDGKPNRPLTALTITIERMKS